MHPLFVLFCFAAFARERDTKSHARHIPFSVPTHTQRLTKDSHNTGNFMPCSFRVGFVPDVPPLSHRYAVLLYCSCIPLYTHVYPCIPWYTPVYLCVRVRRARVRRVRMKRARVRRVTRVSLSHSWQRDLVAQEVGARSGRHASGFIL